MTAAELTREWVRCLVVGESLCPFAAPIFDRLVIEVHESQDENQATDALMTLLNRVADADPEQLPTALLVTPHLFNDFEQYLNWAYICEELLAQMGLEGELQLATFHPQYLFEGEDPDSASHFSNRSPFPMLHIIREADIEQALTQVSHPERIPARNQAHLIRMGKEGILKRMPELAKTAVFLQQD